MPRFSRARGTAMKQDERAPFVRALQRARVSAYAPGEFVEQESFMRAAEIRALAEQAGIAPGVSVLDLCCGVAGPGRFITRELGCTYLGVDSSSSAIDIARESAGDLPCRFEVARIPPIPPGPFDVVLLFETMLAFPDKETLLRGDIPGAHGPAGGSPSPWRRACPLTEAERESMPDADTVWLTPLQEMLTCLERVGLRVRWQEDCSQSHRAVADSLIERVRRRCHGHCRADRAQGTGGAAGRPPALERLAARGHGSARSRSLRRRRRRQAEHYVSIPGKRRGGLWMRATVMYGAGDVRVEDVPDAQLVEPGDALVRVTRAAICGSDLWPYKSMEADGAGRRMGHEFIGVVEAVGTEVTSLQAGDLVASPFLWSDGTCVLCREGMHPSCLHGGRYGDDGVDGGQGEAVRVPQADGTLVRLPVAPDDALMPSLLTLTDVMATGHHAALSARVGPGRSVAVVGDGAVGLCGVIAARRLGAEQIIVLGHHEDRIALARDFGATDVVSERGDEAVQRVRELTDGLGAHSVLECVGHEESTITALHSARPGGAVGRVGVPQEASISEGESTFFDNVTISGGPAPARAYMEELLPDVLEGRIEPGRVFDRVGSLKDVPDGYRAMNDREAIKVMLEL